jgi:hypothetical protein
VVLPPPLGFAAGRVRYGAAMAAILWAHETAEIFRTPSHTVLEGRVVAPMFAFFDQREDLDCGSGDSNEADGPQEA